MGSKMEVTLGMARKHEEGGAMRLAQFADRHVTEVDIVAGLSWYQQARAYCYRLSRRYGIGISTASAVVAALSPKLGWGINQIAADKLIESVMLGYSGIRSVDGSAIPGYNTQKYLAVAILKTDDVSLLSGDKVRAFYHNIRYPDSPRVTVDGHAANIWLGAAGCESNSSIGIKHSAAYAIIESAYVEYAFMAGYTLPMEAQAILWCSLRRVRGLDKRY
jgi:hypothetical protein